MIPRGFKVVPYVEDEHATFVLTTWLESYYDSYGAGTFEWKPKGGPGFEDVYRPTFERILSRPGAHCRVLVLEAVPDLCLAWCLTQRFDGYGPRLAQPVLHYVYTKGLKDNQGNWAYRQRGLATALIREAGIDPSREFRFSHTSKPWDRVLKGEDEDWNGRKYIPNRLKDGWRGARYDPTMARYPLPPAKWKKEQAA